MTVVSKPFTDFSDQLEATELEFFSDASLNSKYGMGGRFNTEWFFTQWPENFIKDNNLSIQYVELLGLTLAVFIWASKLSNKKVAIFVDNTVVRDMVNHTSTGDFNCMILIRKLVLKSLQFNFKLTAKYMTSQNNQIADSLSHLDFKRFKRLAKEKGLKPLPEKLPEELWPVTKIWVKNH